MQAIRPLERFTHRWVDGIHWLRLIEQSIYGSFAPQMSEHDDNPWNKI